MRIYRKKRLKDTSKRNLIIRADKRERFLAFGYIRGKIITSPNDKMHKKTKLSFTIRKDSEVDKAMLSLLDAVNWFTHTTEESEDTDVYNVIYTNAPTKVYMRILRKNMKLTKKNGILYLYTPLTFFAFLTAPSTRYEYINNELSCHINIKKEDMYDVQDWLNNGRLIEITGDNTYSIGSTVNMDMEEITITGKDIDKMIEYISKDKYVKKYANILKAYINKCVNMEVYNGKEESN